MRAKFVVDEVVQRDSDAQLRGALMEGELKVGDEFKMSYHRSMVPADPATLPPGWCHYDEILTEPRYVSLTVTAIHSYRRPIDAIQAYMTADVTVSGDVSKIADGMLVSTEECT